MRRFVIFANACCTKSRSCRPNNSIQRFAGEIYAVPDRPLDLVERVVYRAVRAFAARQPESARSNGSSVSSPSDGSARESSSGLRGALGALLHPLVGQLVCRAPDGREWVAGPRSVIGGLEAIVASRAGFLCTRRPRSWRFWIQSMRS